MRKINLIICLVAMTVLFSFTACDNSGLSKKDKQEIMDEISSLQAQLPIEISGDAMKITDVQFEGNQFVYTVSVSPEFYSNLLLSSEYLKSDETVVNIIQLIGDENIQYFVDKKIGIKYKYVKSDDDSVNKSIDISPERLKEVWTNYKSGNLQKASFLDKVKSELANLQFPSDFGNGVLLTNAYVEGKKVYYEFQVPTGDADSNAFSARYDEMKSAIISSLKEDPNITSYKNEIFDEKVYFIYIYTNAYGNKLLTITLTPQDIFG
ncbi:MAG: hypothetical protein LUC88_02965 [Prevotella sp.]|nr:hypothetical protein [Prevotella sp.]